MALVDLKTQFKSLKFGNDRPGYGSSGLPYIQTSIPGDPSSSGNEKALFNPATNGNLDYPIRGGSVAFQIGQQTYTLSSQLDRTRIAKFLKDNPRGNTFLQKQVGLQLTNPKMETSMLYGMIQNTRVYDANGKNTLAQVAASGTGAHAIRHGGAPFNPLQKTYFATVNQQNILGTGAEAKGLNRLVILNQLKMISPVNPILNPEQASSIGASLNISKVNDLGISLNKNVLFQYLGGPGSSYGIGGTTIGRVVDTTTLKSSRAMVYDQLASRKSQFNNPNPKIEDFRFLLNEEDRVLFGDGRPWTEEDGVDYKFYVKNTKKDRLNTMMPFIFKNDSAPWDVPNEGDQSSKDTIKFVFEAISNDNTNYSTAIFFRAFLTNGITDNNTAAYNAFKYVGRGENFYTYQGFDRSISFAFRVAAHSREELKPMYNRLNALVSQVYPDYSPNTQIMRAPLMRLTVGDYLYRMPGFIESVNLTVGNDMTWEVNLYNEADLAQVPQVVDVSVSFKPIMTELPRRARIDFSEISSETTLGTDSGDVTSFTSRAQSEVPRILVNNDTFIDRTLLSNETLSGTRKATQQEVQQARIRSEQNNQSQLNAFVQQGLA